MSFYKNINIIRAISDLKNGIPISAIIKHKALQTSSKKFYFVKSASNPEILKNINYQIISTEERKLYGKDGFTINLSEAKIEEEILNLLKTIECEPILIKTESLPKEFTKVKINNVLLKDIKDFRQNFIYDLKFIEKAPIQLKMAEKCEFFVFRTPLIGLEHYIIKIGNPQQNKTPLVRIHSSCYTGDLLASLRCDCRDQLQESIKFIENAKEFKGGYILYLMQEGRGIGLANKIKAYKLQQTEGLDTVDSNLAIGFKEDERSFMPAAKMLEFLKIKSICLITNNPKKAEDLTKLGINVKETIHTIFAENQHNKSYLQVKEKRMGHSFE